jgi:hypothetical protein
LHARPRIVPSCCQSPWPLHTDSCLMCSKRLGTRASYRAGLCDTARSRQSGVFSVGMRCGGAVGAQRRRTLANCRPPSAFEVDSFAAGMAILSSSSNGPDPKTASDLHFRSDAGRAQGVALVFGRGRLVVVGEAALFSAQVLRAQGEPDFRFGMNAPGNDDRQFVLNSLHWLSGSLR